MSKLNIGCGFNKLDGFINIDKAKEVSKMFFYDNPKEIFKLKNKLWLF